MGLAEAVVSTFHMVLFSGMDLVLPASLMFHQLRTSGICTTKTLVALHREQRAVPPTLLAETCAAHSDCWYPAHAGIDWLIT